MLEQQLAMNPGTWRALLAHGVTEADELRLDFFFVAPDRTGAELLTTFLREATNYEVNQPVPAHGMPPDATWLVVGKTQPTRVSLQILNEWVKWMVLAGAENGGCRFDGWGAAAAAS
jgi:hypothetical protein